MIKFIKNKNKLSAQRGYAILELLFYIAFFAVLSLVVINSLIVMTGSFKDNIAQAELIQSGGIMERISREVRQAYGIGSISATDLKLNSKDDSGNNKTVEFQLSGSNLKLLDNGTLTDNLNPANISVSSITFTQITTAEGIAVKISLTVGATNDAEHRSVSFNDTVVLRGAY